jgi:hypothetical protein
MGIKREFDYFKPEEFFLGKINEGLFELTGKEITDKEIKLLKNNFLSLSEDAAGGNDAQKLFYDNCVEALRVSYDNIKKSNDSAREFKKSLGLQHTNTVTNTQIYWRDQFIELLKPGEEKIKKSTNDEALFNAFSDITANTTVLVGLVSHWHKKYGEQQQRKMAAGCASMIFLVLGAIGTLGFVVYKIFS